MKRKLCIVSVIAMALATGSAPARAEGESVNVSGSAISIEDETVYNVRVPENLDFTIDPFAIAKRGQVYSDVYEFVNFGARDAVLKITDVNLSFSDPYDFVEMPEAFGVTFESTKKAIYLQLDFGATPYGIIPITGAPGVALDIALPAGGASVPISVGGTVNAYADSEWRSGDVRINLTYRLESLGGLTEAFEEAPDPIAGEESTGSEKPETPPETGDAEASAPGGAMTAEPDPSDIPIGETTAEPDPSDAQSGETTAASDPPDGSDGEDKALSIKEEEEQGNEREHEAPSGDESAGQRGEAEERNEHGRESGTAD
jgi:hypothetical protein